MLRPHSKAEQGLLLWVAFAEAEQGLLWVAFAMACFVGSLTAVDVDVHGILVLDGNTSTSIPVFDVWHSLYSHL